MKMRARRRAPTSALTRSGVRDRPARRPSRPAAHRSRTSSPVRSPARRRPGRRARPARSRPSRNAALRSTVPAQSAGATRMSAAPPSRAATSRPSSSSRTASREEAARTRRDRGASSRASHASAFAPSTPYRFVQRLCSAGGSTARPRPRGGDAGRGRGRRGRRSAGRGPRGRRSGRRDLALPALETILRMRPDYVDHLPLGETQEVRRRTDRLRQGGVRRDATMRAAARRRGFQRVVQIRRHLLGEDDHDHRSKRRAPPDLDPHDRRQLPDPAREAAPRADSSTAARNCFRRVWWRGWLRGAASGAR